MINVIDILHEGHSGGYAKSNDFKVGKLGNNTTTWYVSEFIYTISGEILADSEDSD